MSNPLFVPQREKAGSQTFSKYSYQYHWALEKAVLQHQKKVEYAIFVEFHEDVIYSNSVDQTKAKFEFSQVKTDAAAFTVTKLIKRKNNKSVLGKLLAGTQQKLYGANITAINLVAVNGFSFQLKNPNLKIHKIAIADIEACDVKKLTDEIQNEMANCELPTILNFVIPCLKEENHQKVLIGEISEMIAYLFPNSNYDSTHIYQLLIDDLFRKGQDVFDYQNWEEALARKSLTSQMVTETINAYTSHKDDAVIEIHYLKIAEEIGYNTIERKSIDRAFHRYKNKIYGSRSTQQLRLSQSINASLNQKITHCESDIKKLIDLVYDDIKANHQCDIENKTDAIGAIIYEFIMSQ